MANPSKEPSASDDSFGRIDLRFLTWCSSLFEHSGKEQIGYRRFIRKNISSGRNPLHTAIKNRDRKLVAYILAELPSYAPELDRDGRNALQIACEIGDLEIVKLIVRSDPGRCNSKDKYGWTPLHIATMEGRLDIMKEILSACPVSISDVTEASENSIDIAVRHEKKEALKFLLVWILLLCIERKPYFRDLVHDCAGKTLLDPAVSKSSLQSMLGDRQSSKLTIDVNDMFDVRVMALDILNGSAPWNGMEKIKEMFPKAGSSRAKYVYNQFDQVNFKEFPHSSACKSSIWLSTNENMSVKNLNYVFMLISSFILATLNPPSGVFLEGSFHRMGYSKVQFVNKHIVIRSAVSVAWIISIISVISELQRDPYLLLSLAAIFLGYVGAILAIESPEALPMLKLGGLVLLLAAFMYLAFNRFPLRVLKWFCGRRRSNVHQPESVNFEAVNVTDVDV